LEADAGRGQAAPEAAAERAAPLESGAPVRVGMEVVGSDGRHMGTVKAVRASDFVIDRRFRRELAAPFEAIQEVGERVVLSVPAREATRMDWLHPSG
jgi:sporulation protein YlmC with PRC-barrel domain